MQFHATGKYQHLSLAAWLMAGTALASLSAVTAHAQGTAPKSVETVTVTGTSIRGQAPTGDNLITVDRVSIEAQGVQTVQQLLTSVPQISSAFGTTTQGGQNGDGTGQFIPTIHNLGGGASAATLVLINGHRIPGAGLTVIDTDPTVVPTSALERVEVLPDGASSIYGSDAVAGVINFITRKNFNGVEANAQYGFADGYSSFGASMLWGTSWGSGSVLMDYDYGSRSNLMNKSRGFLGARHDIYQGAADPSQFASGAVPTFNPLWMTATLTSGPGTTGAGGITIPYPSQGFNSQTFNCPVATIATSSTASSAYYYQNGAYGGQAYATGSGIPSQGACDNTYATSAIPSETRNNAFLQVRQEISDNLTFDLEAIYATRVGTSRVARGVVNATVFGPTAGTVGALGTSATTIAAAAAGQVNPFYVGNAATGNSTEFVRYDFQALLGNGATSKTGQHQAIVTSGLTWDLGGDREITLSGTAGQDYNATATVGTVSQAEAFLALNGTTNAAGNPALNSQPNIFGLGSTTITTEKLTTFNALDVWNPAGVTNRTSANVMRALKDGGQTANADQGMQDVVAKFDGPIFDLPAGKLKMALGAEFLHQTTLETGAQNLAAGPSGSNAQEYRISLGRQVYSTFIEFNAPLVSPEMNIPLMQKFEVDVSGRYDNYSDVGGTQNPKFAFNWQVADGLKARGSYGTSFVANDIHHSGSKNPNGFNSESGVAAAATPSPNVVPFPSTAPSTFNGGAGVAGTWVATPASCAAGGGQPVNSTGTILTPPYAGATGCQIAFGAVQGATTSAALRISGGAYGLVPATGNNYTFGVDLDLGKYIGALDGLTASVTYYDVKYHNLKTSVGTQNGIPALTYFAPPGGWSINDPFVQSFISGYPVNVALPTTVYAIFNGTIQNAYNLWQNGLDFDAHYRYRTNDLGNFTFGISGNQILRASQQIAVGANQPVADVKGGKNSGRFPYLEFEGRADISWSIGGWSTNFAVNYSHPYMAANTSFPFNIAHGNLPNGFVHVGANITENVGVSYLLSDSLLGLPRMATDGVRLSLNIDNIGDVDPPLTPNNTGIGNIIGRTITFGIHKTF